MAHARMRPFGDVISLEDARAILDATGAPIDRIETIAAQRSERARARERRHRARRCAAVFARRHGWLRGARARHARRVASGSADADESRNALHRPGLLADSARRRVRRNFHRRADARRRRRRRHGRRNRFGRRHGRARFSPKCSRSRMSGARAPTFKPGRSSSLQVSS